MFTYFDLFLKVTFTKIIVGQDWNINPIVLLLKLGQNNVKIISGSVSCGVLDRALLNSRRCLILL